MSYSVFQTGQQLPISVLALSGCLSQHADPATACAQASKNRPVIQDLLQHPWLGQPLPSRFAGAVPAPTAEQAASAAAASLQPPPQGLLAAAHARPGSPLGPVPRDGPALAKAETAPLGALSAMANAADGQWPRPATALSLPAGLGSAAAGRTDPAAADASRRADGPSGSMVRMSDRASRPLRSSAAHLPCLLACHPLLVHAESCLPAGPVIQLARTAIAILRHGTVCGRVPTSVCLSPHKGGSFGARLPADAVQGAQMRTDEGVQSPDAGLQAVLAWAGSSVRQLFSFHRAADARGDSPPPPPEPTASPRGPEARAPPPASQVARSRFVLRDVKDEQLRTGARPSLWHSCQQLQTVLSCQLCRRTMQAHAQKRV
jgi:hypothetical protein